MRMLLHLYSMCHQKILHIFHSTIAILGFVYTIAIFYRFYQTANESILALSQTIVGKNETKECMYTSTRQNQFKPRGSALLLVHLLLEVSKTANIGAGSVGRATRKPERLLRERVLRRLV